MSEVVRLSAEARSGSGKGSSRALRRAGRVPAVLYGERQEPVLLSLADNEIRKEFKTGQFLQHLCELDLDGKVHQALPKEVQVDKVTDFPIHVDFIRVSQGAQVSVEVQVRFEGEAVSPGLKRGGVLNIVRREVELTCPADAIPDEIVIDLSKANIGDSLHISSVRLPQGVTPTITDRDFTIATITPPTVAPAAEEEAEEEAAEPASES